MKKVWVALFLGITVWVTIILTEDAFQTTARSHAAQNTYTYTVITEFPPSNGLLSHHF